ncbi:MAG: response regulator transcription factor [Clostridia bacterium]|nr:response regulator transcription factor [Clostridia bacterium]
MKGTVYILEDDVNISGLVKFSLEREKIRCKCFTTIKDFQNELVNEIPDLALLDIMLPDGSGLDVLKDLKAYYPSVSCIMLSALGQEADKVIGLNLGADDYISKPFGVMELTARVNASLRRKNGNGVIRIGELALDSSTMTVTLGGEKLDLNKKEFELLKYCMQNTEVVLPRDVLLNEIWGYVDSETRTLDNHIARLRKLGISNFETVFGVGYKFRKNG